ASRRSRCRAVAGSADPAGLHEGAGRVGAVAAGGHGRAVYGVGHARAAAVVPGGPGGRVAHVRVRDAARLHAAAQGLAESRPHRRPGHGDPAIDRPHAAGGPRPVEDRPAHDRDRLPGAPGRRRDAHGGDLRGVRRARRRAGQTPRRHARRPPADRRRPGRPRAVRRGALRPRRRADGPTGGRQRRRGRRGDPARPRLPRRQPGRGRHERRLHRRRQARRDPGLGRERWRRVRPRPHEPHGRDGRPRLHAPLAVAKRGPGDRPPIRKPRRGV
ncbi:MAG: Ribonuclease PH, partial [uncultured Phycisphaerae bacterium]